MDHDFVTPSELREIADLADDLTKSLSEIELDADVLDSSGKIIGHLRRQEDDTYAFEPRAL